MRIDDKRAAEVARRLVEIRRVVNEDVPDLLADRAEREQEIRVLTRALEMLCERMDCDDHCPAYRGEVVCEEDCTEMHEKEAIETARAELANTVGENNDGKD